MTIALVIITSAIWGGTLPQNCITKTHVSLSPNSVRYCTMDRILLRLADRTILQALLVKYHLVTIKQLTPGLYLVRSSSPAQVIKTADALSREFGVIYAHPDYIKKSLNR